MNKKVFFNIAVALILTAVLASCKKDPDAKYSVIYNANALSTSGFVTDTKEYAAGDKAVVKANAFVYAGNTFQHWNTKQDGTGDTYVEGDEITIKDYHVFLYAIWSQNTYTVTFNSNGGSEVAAQTVKEGERATKPADPTKNFGTNKLDFLGWYAPSATAAFEFNTPITDNITLTAEWLSPLGTWKNIGDAGNWGGECTLIITEIEWKENESTWDIASWTAQSNEDAASKDDYPNGYHVAFDVWDTYVYLHKTDPNKLLVFYDDDGYYNNWNIFTRQP